MSETGAGIEDLCRKILRDQLPLLHSGIYFYDPEVRDQFERWATANLRLWECISESLQLGEVIDLVRRVTGHATTDDALLDAVS